jgi:hypothetical protein
VPWRYETLIIYRSIQLFIIWVRTDTRIGDEVAKELQEIAADIVRRRRVAKKNLYLKAISLILLNYRFSEDETVFHVLPLEMVHMIIRFLLDDISTQTGLSVKFI